MILPELQVLTPETSSDAVRMMADHPGAGLLAGGTDLLVLLKQRVIQHRVLIDLGRLPELKRIDLQKGQLHIGAGVTLAAIGKDGLISRSFPALAEAARSVGSPNLRNMATLGGNLLLAPRCLYYNQSRFWRQSLGSCLKTGGSECFAVPGSHRCFACFSADCPPALIALEATVTVLCRRQGTVEERSIPVADLYRDDGQSPLTIDGGSLLTAVHLPLCETVRSAYRKYRRRSSIDFPLSGVAVAFDMVRGKFRGMRIVLNALASSPVLAEEAMQQLEGMPYGDRIMADAVTGLTKRIHPVRNQEGSPEHRRRMAGILFRRAVEELMTA